MEKVATPPSAAAVSQPGSFPVAGFVPIASVTLVVAVVTVAPDASCSVTATAGASVVPEVR